MSEMSSTSQEAEEWLHCLSGFSDLEHIHLNEPLSRYTTLRVGGPCDLFYSAHNTRLFAELAILVQKCKIPHFILGDGSNICVSDRGIRAFVIRNKCRDLQVGELTRVATGYPMMDLFLRTAQAGLSGLEFAVGIPGSVGGALVSNAGAYRYNICELVETIEVVEDAELKEVGPEWMGFAYRDSRLRHHGAPPATLISTTLRLKPDDRTAIFRRARDLQNQRISKQPWYASAGSFFKNVYNVELAQRLEGLPGAMREAGVVPAGYLLSACGCKGMRQGGAVVSSRHANFIINRGGATADDIRNLAETVKDRVWRQYNVRLEEEVIYVGDWD